MSLATHRIGAARIVTADRTYVKHRFRFDHTVASVRDRRGETVAQLTDASLELVETNPNRPKFVWRVAGTDAQGNTVVWRVDDLDCGCGSPVRVYDTPESEIPS